MFLLIGGDIKNCFKLTDFLHQSTRAISGQGVGIVREEKVRINLHKNI